MWHFFFVKGLYPNQKTEKKKYIYLYIYQLTQIKAHSWWIVVAAHCSSAYLNI